VVSAFTGGSVGPRLTVSSQDPASWFAELSSLAAEAEIAPIAASAAAIRTIAAIDAFLLIPSSPAVSSDRNSALQNAQ
jgi:hypothetical protein